MARLPLSHSVGGTFTSRKYYLVARLLTVLAFALLLVVDVTAPVSHGLALFTVRNGRIEYNEGHPVVRFGTFGYCLQIEADFSERHNSNSAPTPDQCSSSGLTYDPLKALDPVTSPSLGSANDRGATRLTTAMVLHPVATCLSFLSLAASASPTAQPSSPQPAPALLCALAAALALAGLICDFALFGGLKTRLVAAATGAVGSYGTGTWALLVATCSLVVAAALLSARWWFGRRLPAGPGATTLHAGVGGQEEGKAEGSLSTVAAPYELEPGVEGGRAELPEGGNMVGRHELGGREAERPAELEHCDQRHELDGTQMVGTYSLDGNTRGA